MEKQEQAYDYMSDHTLKNLINLDEDVACVLETDSLSKATTIMLGGFFSLTQSVSLFNLHTNIL